MNNSLKDKLLIISFNHHYKKDLRCERGQSVRKRGEEIERERKMSHEEESVYDGERKRRCDLREVKERHRKTSRERKRERESERERE